MSDDNKRYKVKVAVDLTAVDHTQQFPESALTIPLDALDDIVQEQVSEILAGMFNRSGSNELAIDVQVKHELVDA